MLTLKFKDVYILESASCVTKKEAEGPLKDFFDAYFEERKNESFEDFEKRIILKTIEILYKKSQIKKEDIDLIIGSDLSNQLSVSSLAFKDENISFSGVYAACASIVLSLIFASLMCENKHSIYNLVYASSNFGTSERQFRYPLEYGGQKRDETTITVSGCGAFIVSSLKGKIKINNATIGRIYDPKEKNPSSLGEIMAYSAFHVIKEHFQNSNTNASSYSCIITGDLSKKGSELLKKMFKNENIKFDNYFDCGAIIYQNKKEFFQGGSGAGCIASTLASFILKKLEEGEFEKVLIVGTGALFSKTSALQNKTIPCISHALTLEKAL